MLPKTKIVCTLGPSSWNREVLTELIKNGMTVARVNGAFADIDQMKLVQDVVRSISTDVALMMDIKGHEVRLNKFENDINVQIGDTVVIGSDNSEYIYAETYPELYKNLHIGANILINDGRVLLNVQKIEDAKIYCKVIMGEKIPSGKGINVPGVYLDNPPITERDKQQINYAVENKWDFVAASFVRSKADVEVVKDLLVGSHTKVISKIEDKFGLENISEIIGVSEGIMVARGDLGIEIPYYSVPSIQKQIIKKCNHAAKPVIVATQMLESMISSPTPTRAEVSDIANAIEDGCDAIMLSGETTTGKYPIECVRVMKEVAIDTEMHLYELRKNRIEKEHFNGEIRDDGTEMAIATAQSVAHLAEKFDDCKIIVDTKTGFTSRLVASFNLKNSIVAVTPYDYYARRLALSKGIIAVKRSEDSSSFENIIAVQQVMLDIANSIGYTKPGDKVILVISSAYSFIHGLKADEKVWIKVVTV